LNPYPAAPARPFLPGAPPLTPIAAFTTPALPNRVVTSGARFTKSLLASLLIPSVRLSFLPYL